MSEEQERAIPSPGDGDSTEESPPSSSTSERLSRRLDEALDAGGDPLQVLADLLASERRAEASVALLDLSGQEIDGYRLKRLLGHGGMGATYVAQNGDGRRVAFKVMLAQRDGSCARFENEVKVLATLRHSSIAAYLAHGQREDGLGWLAMELVEGQSLQVILEELEAGAPSSGVARALAQGCEGPRVLESDAWRRRLLRLLIGVAEALEHAHERHVVHRDVKPQNLLVRDDLSPVVVDFGIARDALRPVSLTRTGAQVGTPGSMAPEQLDGRVKEIGPRTDVFALGLVLWRGLFGRALFASEEELRRYGRRGRALLPAEAQGLPLQLRGILYHALEPQPRSRYGSAGEFAEDLKRLLGDRAVGARAPGALRRFARSAMGRSVFLVFLLVSGLGLFMAGYLLARPKEPYLLAIDAVNRGGVFWFEGEEDRKRSLPVGALEVRPGRYRVHYEYPGTIMPSRAEAARFGVVPHRISREIEIPSDRHHHRHTLLTIGAEKVEGEEFGSRNGPRSVVDRRTSTSAPSALLRLATTLGENTRFSLHNGPTELASEAPGYYWVHPWSSYSVEAFGPEGEYERIEGVEVRASERTEITLLSNLARPRSKDRFELCWGSVFSPRPCALAIDLEDGWVEWLNAQQEPQDPDMQFHIRSVLTPVVLDRWVTARIRVTIPAGRRFRAIKLICFCSWRKHEAEVEARYRCEGGAARPMSTHPASRDPDLCLGERDVGIFDVEAPEGGSHWLDLEIRARTRRAPLDYASVELFSGLLGPGGGRNHWRNDPVFAISADLIPE